MPQGLINAGPKRGNTQTVRATAWAAGLFDGDGCVFMSYQKMPERKNPSYRLCLSLVQNDLPTVERFRAVLALPSTIIEVRRTTSQNRQVYDLRYYGVHAVSALEAMHADLVRKKWESAVAQRAWVAGQMGVLPGPNGLPARIWKIRESYRRKLARLK